ncbi:MAG TPA: hypothetical protein VN203_23500, partial [Candidatus Acidoferrum sp.]|nr:hypothetical protein [Candidatus Acidoferrum sp.]
MAEQIEIFLSPRRDLPDTSQFPVVEDGTSKGWPMPEAHTQTSSADSGSGGQDRRRIGRTNLEVVP